MRFVGLIPRLGNKADVGKQFIYKRQAAIDLKIEIVLCNQTTINTTLNRQRIFFRKRGILGLYAKRSTLRPFLRLNGTAAQHSQNVLDTGQNALNP